MIDEEVADRQSPFRLGIEAYAVVRQRERVRIDTKALSNFGVELSHNFTKLKKLESQGSF